MKVIEFLDTLHTILADIDVEEYAPHEPVQTWETVLGVMSTDMRRVHARIKQLNRESGALSRYLERRLKSSDTQARVEYSRSEFRLNEIGLELTLHEALLGLLILKAFPQILKHPGDLDARKGWQLVMLPPEEDALTPQERFQRFSLEQPSCSRFIQ